jgi:16S rRNA (cytidine1402-2'-O)-methyltransferase
MPARLYLVPNFINEDGVPAMMPGYIAPVIKHLRYFMVEEPRSARRLLKKINRELDLSSCVFFSLNEHTNIQEASAFVQQNAAQDIGLISESGCPCVADPGREIVALAHQEGREVIPLIGPSSIILALMASGLNGQNFAFNGYLSREKEERIKQIKGLEKRVLQEGQTQIIMEAPYRNERLFADILAACGPQTRVCVAAGLTGPAQLIKTLTVKEWKNQPLTIDKQPALFLIGGSK